MNQPRPKPWPLARVYGERPSAVAVYLALAELADERGSPVVTPTRERLAQAVGVSKLRTISDALSTLERAGWIHRTRVPVMVGGRHVASVLRIVIRRKGRSNGPYGAKRRKGRSNGPSVGRAVSAAHDSLTERGRGIPAAAPLNGRATAAPEPLPAEHPSVRIERERLEAIKAQRTEARP